MSKIKWDQIGEKKFKTGVDRGVIYPMKGGAYPKGTAWNGLTAVNKNPSGAEDNKFYADNILYANIRSAETLGLTLECYMYPVEFEACNGEKELAEGVLVGQQNRSTFGFSYRNLLGNDTENTNYGYELNLVYGCSASPSEQANNTINDSPDLATFSYEISTIPVNVSGLDPDGNPFKPTACLTIDSTRTPKDKLAALEEILYGKEGAYAKATDVVLGGTTEYYEILPNGDYVKTSDSEVDETKVYYTQTTAPVEGRLPLPDEIKGIMAAG